MEKTRRRRRTTAQFWTPTRAATVGGGDCMMGDGEGKEELLLLGEINDADAAPASRAFSTASRQRRRENAARMYAHSFIRAGAGWRGGFFFTMDFMS
tara:strand:- start:79 stop:369 length:291 start_codon:yes stop_codon:yes gene_type:complete